MRSFTSVAAALVLGASTVSALPVEAPPPSDNDSVSWTLTIKNVDCTNSDGTCNYSFAVDSAGSYNTPGFSAICGHDHLEKRLPNWYACDLQSSGPAGSPYDPVQVYASVDLNDAYPDPYADIKVQLTFNVINGSPQPVTYQGELRPTYDNFVFRHRDTFQFNATPLPHYEHP